MKNKGILYREEQPHTEKPMASEGLISYRCKGRYGWIMIGATDNEDALNEASRSTSNVMEDTLEVWDKGLNKYVSAYKQTLS